MKGSLCPGNAALKHFEQALLFCGRKAKFNASCEKQLLPLGTPAPTLTLAPRGPTQSQGARLRSHGPSEACGLHPLLRLGTALLTRT